MNKRFSYLFLFCSLLFHTAIAQSQIPEGTIFSIPWTNVGNVPTPYIRVKLAEDNIPRLFVLDTGSPASIIATEVARTLKLPTKPYKFNNGTTVEITTCLTSLGPEILRLADIPFILMDMSVTRQHYPEIAGIIGTNLLQSFALRLDFQKRLADLIYVKKIAGTVFEPKDAIRIPFTYTATGDCFIEGELDGKATRFAVDTGTDQTFLRVPSLIAALNPTAKLDGFTNSMFTDAGMGMQAVQARKLRLKNLKIGGAEWKAPVVEEILTIGKHRTNALGVDFLQRYRVIVDIPGRMLYLTPDTLYKPDEREWFGVGLELAKDKQKRVFVSSVLKPSPAEAAHIEEGEEVIQIDGEPVSDVTSYALAEWWQKKQKEADEVVLTLKIRVNTKTRTVKLKVVKLL